ncbi:MAG: T9SS type A sorting domain-containing protein [Flavobacteriales bacterium]|nr:T9SS type A sorting domain-containing protein [Flavobacteriales bacterium]
MKRLLLLLTLTFTCYVSFAQTDFCVPGATWVYYSEGIQAVNPAIERLVTYVGDTVFSEAPEAKVLKIEEWSRISNLPISFNQKFDYINQRNDSLFRLVDGSWRLMFDFNALQGDTAIVFVDGWAGCNDLDTMVIDSVYLSMFLGMQVKRYDYRMLIQDHWNDFGWTSEIPQQYTNGVSGTYYEKLGFPIGLPAHQPANCEVFVLEYLPIPLVCYTDDELISNGVQPCSLVLSAPSEMKQSNVEMSFVSSLLLLQNARDNTFHVYDILGKELLKGRITLDNQTFDLNHLSNGILMIVLESDKSRITKKVIKTSN